MNVSYKNSFRLFSMSHGKLPKSILCQLPICSSVHVFFCVHVFMWRFDRDDLPQVASSAREARSELLAPILLHSM